MRPKPHDIVLGIDPSLNGTAFVKKKGQKVLDYWFFTGKVGLSKQYENHAVLQRDSGVKRLNSIYEFYTWYLKENVIDFVGIESYSYGSVTNSAFQIGGCGELLRLLTYREGIPFKEYEPSVVKKFATGSGTAGKPDMMAAAIEHGFDVRDYGKSGEDLADAYWIAELTRTELRIKGNPDLLNSLTVKEREVFLATSKKNPTPMIERPFIGGT